MPPSPPKKIIKFAVDTLLFAVRLRHGFLTLAFWHDMKDENAPKVFLYNPTCEIAIANGDVNFMPGKTLVQFERDLDVFPMYFAREQDVVLVHQLPDQNFLDILEKNGLPIPEFKLVDSAFDDLEFVKRKKLSLEPWGWSPRIHHILAPLKKSCSQDFLSLPNAYWKHGHRHLYSRKTALKLLEMILEEDAGQFFVAPDQVAQACTSVSEVEEKIEAWGQVVIKAPWSSSGRGLQVLRRPYLNNSTKQWINGTLASQAYVMVEALLDKEHDFSLQYFCNGKGGFDFLGPGFFETNANGQYLGNLLGRLPSKAKSCFPDSLISNLSERVMKALRKSEIANSYSGYLGIDCMTFADKLGNIRVQPCVEINLRYNMGTMAIFLNKHIHPDSTGHFQMYFDPRSTFGSFHTEMERKYPFEKRDGKWAKGYLPLVSPFQDKSFGVYLMLDTSGDQA